MDPNTRALMMGAAGAGGAEELYVEDVFQTWLYTGNGSTQTITNGIDLAGKGGLVWIKQRSSVADHFLFDTARGARNHVNSNNTGAQEAAVGNTDLYQYNSDGFTLGANYWGGVNTSSETFASWTFREAAKFFDVVTWTAGSSTNRRISHSLGSAPGLILIKNYSGPTADNWYVYHRSLGRSAWIMLNQTSASSARTNAWGTSDPTSSDFGIDETFLTQPGETHVAYLFAHDAGGFGDSGNDSVVKCGSYSGSSFVDLGWEPQWLLLKPASTAGTDWYVFDNMRGLGLTGNRALSPNLSSAEIPAGAIRLSATGFTDEWLGYNNTIYIAIRRGPMKTPTDATKVFNAKTRTGTGTVASVTDVGFPPDLSIHRYRAGATTTLLFDKPRGPTARLTPQGTAAEATNVASNLFRSFDQNGVTLGDDSFSLTNTSGQNYSDLYFRRAPGFFDVVAYTGTGAAQTVSHNLGVVPELLIIKGRNQSTNWKTYYSFTSTTYKDFNLNTTSAASNGTYGPGGFPNFESFSTAPTATSFSVSANSVVINNTGTNYIGYLFATVTAVSKVGTYTGTGTTLNIDCGFTAGARFVLIKRTDSSGDWYVWDTARGIVSGNDPYLLLNSSVAEDTSTDYIDPLNAGFQISSTAPAAINANGGSFIFLAVA